MAGPDDEIYVFEGNRLQRMQLKDVNIFDGSASGAQFAFPPTGRLYVKHPNTGGLHEVLAEVNSGILMLRVNQVAAA